MSNALSSMELVNQEQRERIEALEREVAELRDKVTSRNKQLKHFEKVLHRENLKKRLLQMSLALQAKPEDTELVKALDETNAELEQTYSSKYVSAVIRGENRRLEMRRLEALEEAKAKTLSPETQSKLFEARKQRGDESGWNPLSSSDCSRIGKELGLAIYADNESDEQ